MARASTPVAADGATVARPDGDALSAAELQRYHRHLILPEVGPDGQRRLKRASALIVGAGGLGSPVALYLAAAGIGCIGIVDFDAVDASNLQRQLLHGTTDVGRPKTASARDRLGEVNPFVAVETHETTLTAANALGILERYDVVVDGTDNFQTRYLVNDACVLLRKPNVYGSVFRFDGQASVFSTPDGPCYRCLFREPPPPGMVPSCAEGGVFGVLPGLIGMIQATETIKLITGIGESLVGRLLLVDALRMSFRTIALRRDPLCPMCGTHEITELIDYDAFCGVAPAPMADEGIPEITPRDLSRRLARGDALLLIDVREPYERAIVSLPDSLSVPLGALRDAIGSLARDRELVVYCHHGPRSMAAVEFLRAQGFPRVWNLTGGIARWSDDVDPSLPRY